MVRESSKARQVSMRIDKMDLERAAALADRLSKPGYRVAITDALRMAIARGLDAFDAEASAPEPASNGKPKPKPKR